MRKGRQMTRPTLVMIPGTLCDARVFKRQKMALRGIASTTAALAPSLARDRDYRAQTTSRPIFVLRRDKGDQKWVWLAMGLKAGLAMESL